MPKCTDPAGDNFAGIAVVRALLRPICHQLDRDGNKAVRHR